MSQPRFHGRLSARLCSGVGIDPEGAEFGGQAVSAAGLFLQADGKLDIRLKRVAVRPKDAKAVVVQIERDAETRADPAVQFGDLL